jgi:hypothetical protein
MAEDNARDNSGESTKVNNDSPHGNLWWWITIGSFLAFTALLLVSILHPNMPDRARFFTTNLLSLCILVTVIVQAVIYFRQWEVMKETLTETRRIFDLTERPVVIAKSASVNDQVPDQPLNPKVTFANRGRTAAQKVEVTAEVARYWPAFGFIDTDANPTECLLLTADEEVTVSIAPADAVSLDREALTSPDGLFIHGKGSYEDLAGRKYPIAYAFWYVPGYGFTRYPYPKQITVSEESEKAGPN